METPNGIQATLSTQRGRLFVHMGDQTEDLLNFMATSVPNNRKMVMSLLPQIAGIVILEIGLPLGLYFGLRQPTGPLNPVWALLIAGCPPLAIVILKLVVKCKIDAAGLLAVTAFAAAAIVAAATQNARILLLEKSIITGAIGLVFAISLIPFQWTWKGRVHRLRPLTYMLCAQFLPVDLTYDEAENPHREPISDASVQEIHSVDYYQPDDFEGIDMFDLTSSANNRPPDTAKPAKATEQKKSKKRFGFEKVELPLFKFMYAEIPSFRLVCIVITAVWSIGFLIELAVRLIMIFTISDFDKVFLYSNIVFIVFIVLCGVLTSAVSLMGRFRTLRELNQYILQGPR
jgi:hypothetical protein